MIELNRNQSSSQLRGDVEGLKQLAAHRRDKYRQHSRSFYGLRHRATASLASPGTWLRTLPTRFVLHAVVALTVPLALLLSQLPARSITPPLTETTAPIEVPLGIGPIELGHEALPMVGDPPLSEDEALPVPLSLSSRSELLAPLTVPAMISGDVVKLRNGPGLAYDEVSRISGGEGVEVVGRYEEWLQVRRDGDQTLYWVASELVDVPDTVVFNLAQVPAELIPAPPPAKVGTVREEGVNLRDGPRTNYVSMARMGLGQDLTLVERYEGWFLVEYGSQYGWVTADFLNIISGVIERVPVAQSIPDPNPSLVGTVLENAVNLRKGPGSAYDRVGSVDAGSGVSLLAKHKDWFRVQLENGTKAWIFSDLLKVSPMAVRRVPATNDIPALPARARASLSGGGSSASVSIPASGDVAGYAVQFIGSRYRWGGSSPSGFDCSGLTSYVYRQFGVGLPHSAAAQYSTRIGAMIGSLSSLAPGDLVFFAGTGGHRGISHVAIYIGGGQIVHAMTPRYGVQVSGVWSSYWQNHFVGAIRPYR
ncbi:MAG: SH3 domain-containing protein [Chloroflexales bacterium]|nr:SH3 domain-containing protein [Chloroflexales bacterium]